VHLTTVLSNNVISSIPHHELESNLSGNRYYKRFLDHTDGKFHSDYLMKLRYTGLRLANKRISDVSYEDVYRLK
jgi:hypothetical protein